MSAQRQLRCNARGSWAHVCSFDASETERIQDGAELLLLASGGSVSFKIVDDAGYIVSLLDCRTEPLGWSDRL